MRWLVIVALVVTAEQAAAKDDFCRDMWLKLDASGRAEFAAQSDAKAFAKAAPDVRPRLLECAAKDGPRLVRRLDAMCSGAPVAPETVVAELMEHVERCAPVLPSDNTGTAEAVVLHESLSARVEKLESELKALRQEVAALRAGGHQGALERRAAPTPAGPPGWKNRANWRALRKGMNQEAVRGLLGEPDHVEVETYWTEWAYGERGNGGGHMRFEADPPARRPLSSYGDDAEERTPATWSARNLKTWDEP